MKFFLYYMMYFFVIVLPLRAANVSHHPQEFLDEIKSRDDQGKQIFNHYCTVCHSNEPKIFLGAPRADNVKDWQQRLEKGKKSILQHTYEGYNAMPPRGGCFECTDQQLYLAIIAMLPKDCISSFEKKP